MWWLSQMVADHAEQVAAPAPTPEPAPVPAYMAPMGSPSQNAQGFSTAGETAVVHTLADLCVEVSPLTACRILFAPYDECDASPRPAVLDEMFNPCPDGHADTFEWLSPRETLHRLCRRCGRPA